MFAKIQKKSVEDLLGAIKIAIIGKLSLIFRGICLQNFTCECNPFFEGKDCQNSSSSKKADQFWNEWKELNLIFSKKMKKKRLIELRQKIREIRKKNQEGNQNSEEINEFNDSSLIVNKPKINDVPKDAVPKIKKEKKRYLLLPSNFEVKFLQSPKLSIFDHIEKKEKDYSLSYGKDKKSSTS